MCREEPSPIGPCLATDSGSSPLSLVLYREQAKPKCLLSRSVPLAITSPSTVGHSALVWFHNLVRLVRGNPPYTPLAKDADRLDLTESKCARVEYN
jgi:hypothetical protein